jgi:hypothetical protein
VILRDGAGGVSSSSSPMSLSSFAEAAPAMRILDN